MPSLSQPHRILLVDDDVTLLNSIARFLERAGFIVILAASGVEALRLLKQTPVDLVLVDEQLPNLVGHALILPIRQIIPDLPVIVMTGMTSVQNAVESIQSGANDYLPKPLNLEDLVSRLERALNSRKTRPAPAPSPPPPEVPSTVLQQGYYKGASAVRTRIREEITELASIPALTALITGETGTGKEVIARKIHIFGPNAHQPFIVINCAALSEEAWEAELFGVDEGWDGAVRGKPGFLEAAGEGTLLFDEITALSPLLQSHLLHLLDERSFRRLGGVVPIQLKARCLFTTNRPLLPLVQSGVIRQDFYFRISMFTLHLPPLRETRDDILPLAWHFLGKMNKQYGKAITQIPNNVQRVLQNYNFPGNILELSHLIERGVIGTTGSVLYSDPIFQAIQTESTPPAPPSASATSPSPLAKFVTAAEQSLEKIENEAIRRVLSSCKGNKSKAAKILGISRRALYRRLEKIEGESDSGAAGK
jgi:DNA-binding NtrC family response regulator